MPSVCPLGSPAAQVHCVCAVPDGNRTAGTGSLLQQGWTRALGWGCLGPAWPAGGPLSPAQQPGVSSTSSVFTSWVQHPGVNIPGLHIPSVPILDIPHSRSPTSQHSTSCPASVVFTSQISRISGLCIPGLQHPGVSIPVFHILGSDMPGLQNSGSQHPRSPTSRVFDILGL